jgi:hypothetical protein
MIAAATRDRARLAVTRSSHAKASPVQLLALAGGALLTAIGAGLVAAHVTVFALDETLIQQSAVHYASNLPHSLLHDLDARATNRLYPLVLSIAYRLSGGASAVRIDHVLSVLMFVSAAIPIYLFARVILRSAWAAVAVALLSIAVPWLTLTSALFTENLSYPLFWWMVLATCNAVWRPSISKDVLALTSIALLVCTRVQFAAVFVGYLIALLAIGVWRADANSGGARRLGAAALQTVRRYPLSLMLVAGAIAGFVYEQDSGHWQNDVERLLGTYSNVVIRSGVSPNMVEGLLVELIALVLGVGLLPAVVAIPWYARRMSRPQMDRRWIFLLTTGVVLLAFLVLTVFSQGGYLGPVTEERYFFYVIPAFWLGAFAAFEDRDVRTGELLGCAVGLAALYGAIPFLSPLTQETAFLAPAESAVPHILTQRMSQLGLAGLTVQDALALLALLAGIATAIVWRRWPRARPWWTLGAAAMTQLLIAGYAYAVIDGKVQGIPGRTGSDASALSWVDTHAHSHSIAWIDDLPAAAPPTGTAYDDYQTRTTLFWNSRLTRWALLAQLGLPPVGSPLSALPGIALSIATRTGLLTPPATAAGMTEAIGAVDSPFLQLAGATLARSPDGALALTAPSQPARATWLATGLQPDGAVLTGAPVRLFAFASSAAKPRTRIVTFTLAAPTPPTPATSMSSIVTIQLGAATRRYRLRAGAPPMQIGLPAYFAARQTVVYGFIDAGHTTTPGQRVAGMIERVTLSPYMGTSSSRTAR